MQTHFLTTTINMTDADSLFSFTDTLVDSDDASTMTLTSNSQDAICTLVLHEAQSHLLDIEQLQRAGLPSSWQRSDKPADVEVTSSRLRPPKLTKRLHLRVPRAPQLLQAVRIPPITDLASLAEARKLAGKMGRMRTIYDSELCELVGRRERTRMHAVVRWLFGSRTIKSSKFFYPPQRVILPADLGATGVPVQWASLTITSPPLGTAPDEESSSPADDLKKTLECMRSKTDDQLLAQLFKPTAHAEAMLDDVLNALEARGGIWTVAAHRSRPQPRNADPYQRPEFVVQGLFPKVGFLFSLPPDFNMLMSYI